MNIKEHNAKIQNILQLSRISNKNGEIAFPEFDYGGLTRPPIHSYLPFNIINQIKNLVHDPKLMARPSQKYKLMNEILRPIGFRHLASGTNRRTFYSIFDEGIVLKIALDSVGEEANLREYQTQYFIQPFCAKTFDVLPDGLIALSERVEPMREEDYKNTWSSDIFDFIFQILNRGYIMEDVGGNFFKNWGVRFGFGPVILDYPYIYEIDWHKLKCSKKDPITNDKCLGDLDYDYSRGMSEIICTKCGARYSAKYLAKLVNVSEINKRRENIMSLIPTEVKVTTMRGSNVLRRFYSETEERKDPDVSFAHDGSPIITSCIENPMKSKLNEKEEHSEKKFEYYPRPIKNDIIFFLKKMEQKHGEEVAIDLADKLKIRYNVVGYHSDKAEPSKITNTKESDNDKINSDWRERIKKCASSEYTEIIVPDKEKNIKPEITAEVPVQKLDEVNKNLRKYSIDEESIKGTNDTVVDIDMECKHEIQENLENDMEKVLETINTTENYNLNPKSEVTISKDEVVNKSKDNKNSFVKPTEGLFPSVALTPEEIESLRVGNTHETGVMGFPGEPLVDQMRFKDMIPRIKNLVKIKFDNFNIEGKMDPDEIGRKLSKEIRNYILEDIENLMNGDVEKLVVDATKTVNERNEECFAVHVENRGTKIFDLTLYPKKKEEIKEKEDKKEKPFDMNEFLIEVVEGIDLSKYLGYTEDRARKEIIHIITNAILEKGSSGDIEQEAFAHEVKNAEEIATNFVKYYLNFNEIETEEETETSISDELI